MVNRKVRNPRGMRVAPKHASWMPFILANLRILPPDFSQSVASGVQIIETLGHRASLMKAIESLHPSLTSERRASVENESYGLNFPGIFQVSLIKRPGPSIEYLAILVS